MLRCNACRCFNLESASVCAYCKAPISPDASRKETVLTVPAPAAQLPALENLRTTPAGWAPPEALTAEQTTLVSLTSARQQHDESRPAATSGGPLGGRTGRLQATSGAHGHTGRSQGKGSGKLTAAPHRDDQRLAEALERNAERRRRFEDERAARRSNQPEEWGGDAGRKVEAVSGLVSKAAFVFIAFIVLARCAGH